MAFAKVLTKLAGEAAKVIRKQNPSISNKELTKEVNEMMGKIKPPKPKPKAPPATGLSKPTVAKNKRKSEYEANIARMGGGSNPGSNAARQKAMIGKELQDAWQGLSKTAKNAERVKGKKSEFYSIIRKLSPTRKRKPVNTPETKIDTSNFGDDRYAGSLKAGGKVMKRKAGGKVSDTKNAMPKDKPTPPIGKGAVARGNRMSKMEVDSAKAVNKKMGGGQVMKYKKGGMVYKKHGGVVKAASGGDSLIASCYD